MYVHVQHVLEKCQTNRIYVLQQLILMFPLIHVPEEYTIINLHLILYHVIAKVKSPLHSHSNELHFVKNN